MFYRGGYDCFFVLHHCFSFHGSEPALNVSSSACYTLNGSLEWVGRLLAAMVSDLGLRLVVARGKSEHRRATEWLTARRGDPTTSATENRPADGFVGREPDVKHR